MFSLWKSEWKKMKRKEKKPDCDACPLRCFCENATAVPFEGDAARATSHVSRGRGHVSDRQPNRGLDEDGSRAGSATCSRQVRQPTRATRAASVAAAAGKRAACRGASSMHLRGSRRDGNARYRSSDGTPAASDSAARHPISLRVGAQRTGKI
jgi:hypothetical protein